MAKRFFRHGELHLVLLSLCAQGPRHGYELMGELGDLFGPRYRPSAGSVYPAVDALTLEGLLEGWEEGGRHVYGITPAGSDALERRADAVAALEARTSVRLGHRNDVDASIERFTARVRQLAPALDADELDDLLTHAAADIERAASTNRRAVARHRRSP
jgi:DNA-binding PadR family transcriptional regulator